MNQNTFRIVRVAAAAAVVLWMGGVLAVPAHAEDTQANIPQAKARITNWVPNNYRGIWIEVAGRQWYYGEFLGPCIGIGAGDTVAFEVNPDGSLNQFSRVIVSHPYRRSCAFRQFVASAGPSSEKAGAAPRPFISQ